MRPAARPDGSPGPPRDSSARSWVRQAFGPAGERVFPGLDRTAGRPPRVSPALALGFSAGPLAGLHPFRVAAALRARRGTPLQCAESNTDHACRDYLTDDSTADFSPKAPPARGAHPSVAATRRRRRRAHLPRCDAEPSRPVPSPEHRVGCREQSLSARNTEKCAKSSANPLRRLLSKSIRATPDTLGACGEPAKASVAKFYIDATAYPVPATRLRLCPMGCRLARRRRDVSRVDGRGGRGREINHGWRDSAWQRLPVVLVVGSMPRMQTIARCWEMGCEVAGSRPCEGAILPPSTAIAALGVQISWYR